MNVYEEIVQETMMLLLDPLCKRTLAEKQIWENMSYNPISFLQKDIYETEDSEKDYELKLGEKLMKEHRMLDFHKIVLDTDYRRSLLMQELT